jgi:hypothetical protein
VQHHGVSEPTRYEMREKEKEKAHGKEKETKFNTLVISHSFIYIIYIF